MHRLFTKKTKEVDDICRKMDNILIQETPSQTATRISQRPQRNVKDQLAFITERVDEIHRQNIELKIKIVNLVETQEKEKRQNAKFQVQLMGQMETQKQNHKCNGTCSSHSVYDYPRSNAGKIKQLSLLIQIRFKS